METINENGDQYQWLYGIISEDVADHIRSIVGD